MRHYETTFIIDPVLSGDDMKATAQTYIDLLTAAGCSIVHVNEMGLRQLAYSISKRHSGTYYCIEHSNADGNFIVKFELALRRDEKILRFLTVSLDKHGIKFNADKRAGLIGNKRKKALEAAAEVAAALAATEAADAAE